MGKRRHNVKGRQVNDVIVDNTETKKVGFDIEKMMCCAVAIIILCRQSKIKLEINGQNDEYGYDQSNALVLPSKKRETKIKKTEQKHVTRILSKKQRKNLEKIVEKKKKKEGVSKFMKNLSIQK